MASATVDNTELEMAKRSKISKVSYLTQEVQGQCVKMSSFNENRLAASFTNEFGHVGEGYVYVLEKNEDTGELDCLIKIDYRDNIFDVSFNDKDPNLLTTAAGDGWVQIWNLGNKYPKVATHEFKGHRKEMSSVDWNMSKFSDHILAASWDGTVCTYDVTSQWPLVKIPASELIVHQAIWSPHSAKYCISVSTDGVFQLWDLNVAPPKSSIFLSASDDELLTCDWSRCFPWLVATAGSDCLIKGWDLRNYALPLFVNEDHGQAVKKIKFSPWHQTLIASASYDATVRLFDYQVSSSSLELLNHHTEHVYGVAWNNHKKNEIVSCGWDSTVQVLTPESLKDS